MDLEDAVFKAGAAEEFGGGKPVWKLALLAHSGTVSIADQLVRYIRPGLTEEYSVSMDGVRQDFVVLERPEGAGQLRMELDVTGAKAEPLANGARLVLERSGRKIAYSRLRATDAQRKELTATMAVLADTRLVVVDHPRASRGRPVRCSQCVQVGLGAVGSRQVRVSGSAAQRPPQVRRSSSVGS